MNMKDCISCVDKPCTDMDTRGYVIPDADINPADIRIIMIAESPPPDPADHFYATGMPFYLETTIQAFNEAGAPVRSMQDIIDLGVYITTAVKCAKTSHAISRETIARCSSLLNEELSLFPGARVYMLMGDVAIRAMNNILRKPYEKSIIPTGSTYKLRGQAYYAGDVKLFPSYTPAGKSFLIEKSKRRMVVEDIREALKIR